MKELKRDLKSVVKSLKVLEEKTKQMAKKVDKLEKAQAPKESKEEPKAAKKAIAKKPTRVSASETVLAIIKRSRKGIARATLKNRTGLKDNNIRTILYRLKKQGKIKSARYGLYVKA